ncbi:MAG: hypothetical protein AB2A00_06890 [Myxococcota bacterium]
MDGALPELTTYLQGLKPQRLILRAVDEVRPQGREGPVVVGRVTYVEVVTVVDGARVVRRFEGVLMDDAKAAATGAGHTVLERSGNIT